MSEPEEETIDLGSWPNCVTPDCPHKRCLWGGTEGYCYRCGEYLYGKPYMRLQFFLAYGEWPDNPDETTPAGEPTSD